MVDYHLRDERRFELNENGLVPLIDIEGFSEYVLIISYHNNIIFQSCCSIKIIKIFLLK